VYRLYAEFEYERDFAADWTFETTVAERRDASDLLGWRGLGRGLDEFWGIGKSDESWYRVLEPANRRTLRDVCEFIAPRIRVPRVRPASVFGRECLAAGVFLSIRSMLKKAGANTDDLAPSTPLAEYTRQYLEVFFNPVAHRCPNALPAAIGKRRLDGLMVAGFLLVLGGGALALGTILVSDFFHVDSPFVAIGGVRLAGILLPALWIFSWFNSTKSAAFGELQSFRNMSEVIASHIAREAASE